MNTQYEITDELGHEWVYSHLERQLYWLDDDIDENTYAVASYEQLQEYVSEGGSNKVAGFNEDDARNFLEEVRPLFEAKRR